MSIYKRYKVTVICVSTVMLVGVSIIDAHAKFNINLIPASGINPLALTGFQKAAGLWSSIFTDNVTININVDFAGLGSGIIGQTNAESVGALYGDVRKALIADATSPDDFLAVAHLQTGNALTFETNSKTGASIVDNNGTGNNTTLDITRANAKVLGLLSGKNAASDASITFSSNFSFDFDPSDGISAGKMDFVGVAAHEIGHALGFISGVDTVDYFSGPKTGPDGKGGTVAPLDLDPFRVFNVLDLYRYSSTITQVANGARIQDLRQGVNSYFSLDGGTTNIARFSTGPFDGDGRQASHWKDNLGLGIMDPTAGFGEKISANLGSNDIRAFDAIGYNLNLGVAAPEPASLALLSFGVLGGLIVRRRKG